MGGLSSAARSWLASTEYNARCHIIVFICFFVERFDASESAPLMTLRFHCATIRVNLISSQREGNTQSNPGSIFSSPKGQQMSRSKVVICSGCKINGGIFQQTSP